MNKGKWYWAAMAVLAFASIISFFQINSYWSDKHHFNGLIGWLGIGIICGLGAIVCLAKVRTMSDDQHTAYIPNH